ncbi:MAG: transglycosylase domain-containing protein [Candidatus Cardinium sp.]|uniref:transglycosylase domain-containing protein n=1 Tax=Cardinium endosymbiont of Dermatophagoides farinae TaxID=2597823 RepID=UPI0011826871|nr:transglycosylase domain-containing protein [Cardinium endosymbiont of Dermatophagoides farinae]TSJ80730.1 penicillin-binding protein [Cardinium endosymbiont of Dermatophagoides farinae]UWW96728.1 MAG: transglycosylase domain-containing protein [Candidatus Cardinium sp.]
MEKIIRILWKLFAAVIIGIPIYLFSVQVDFYNLYGSMPSTDLLENPQDVLASELYAADGILLGKYFRDNRSPVTYEEISPNMIHALIASEDYRFEQHAGIDLWGLSRAFFLSIILQQNKGGGSTLTQQLAKNLFNIRKEVSYRGKCSSIPLLSKLILKTKEWILAVQLERAYTKQEIIAMYLNTVTFGSNTYGIKVAARTFFNKTPADLRIEEAALLVGLLRAPTRYSPIKHPKSAHHIRNVVLSQMVKYGFLKQSEYDLICEIPTELHYQEENYEKGIAPYFRGVVRDFLLKWTKENGYDLFSDGLRIYTTIDSRVQTHAEAALKEHMALLQNKFDHHWKDQDPWVHENGNEIVYYIENEIKKTPLYKKLRKEYGTDTESIDRVLHTPIPTTLFSWEGPIQKTITPIEAFKHDRRILQAGCMAMNPYTGHIKAWVGGIDYKYFKYDHVKQSKRQAGSTFKPIVYTVALENGFLPTDVVKDEPVTFLQPNGSTWTPQNAWKTYSGNKYTLRYAMAKSYNSITSYLIKVLGPQLVVDCAKRMGIQGPLDPVPAICLGCSDASIYEMVGAYSTFLNRGVWTKPFFITHIEDKHGNILQTFIPQRQEAIHEDTADLMTHMLQGSLDEGALNSVSMALRAQNGIAGKSGTTSNHSDGWFIGLTQNLCTGVWVGGEDRCIHFRDFELGAGRATAQPIWEKFIIKLYNDPDLPYKKGPLITNHTLSEKVKNIIQSKPEDPLGQSTDSATGPSTDNKKKIAIELDIDKIL